MGSVITFVMTLAGLLLAFFARSTGALAIGLLLAACGFVGFIFALAANRISANARSEASMATVEDLAALRKGRPPLPARAPADPAAKKLNETGTDPTG